ncbi:MAG: ComEC/Rec2 family competence protein [Chitinophagaceae bacterium]
MLYVNDQLHSQFFFLSKKAPLLKILLAFITGIVCQYYCQFSFYLLCVFTFTFSIITVLSLLVSYRVAFMYRLLFGIALLAVVMGIGATTVYVNNGTHQKHSITQKYIPNSLVFVTVQEPLVEKQNSYKAIATINAIKNEENEWEQASGNLLLYFKKDSTQKYSVGYGNQLVIKANLTPIQNAGNPGGFNYKQYCAFQNIYYQTFLQSNNFIVTNTIQKKWFQEWLLNTRQKVLNIIESAIHEKNEQSVAEALLIGYRGNLDRDLVQAYSNTGIVHIIAISGLHLGMIYELLLFLFKPFQQQKWVVLIKPICILIVIWLFTLLAGAVPSILRSAVMFTCIVIGDVFGKRTNIYNMIAASALLILLIQPYSLWDVGFQLSYAAVLSIVLFSKKIEQLFYFENKLLQLFSTLLSVTIAAQIFTMPILLYHFHQLPTLFLFTNILAVPLSTIVLYLLLLLVVFGSIFQSLVIYLGWVIDKILWVMNDFVVAINELPFAVIGGIQINLFQVVILFVAIACFALWIHQKKPSILVYALACCTVFLGIRFLNFMQVKHQQKLVVYNVPKHLAVDLIAGRDYLFLGDTVLLRDGFLRNFHLQPSRVKHRLNGVLNANNYFIKNHLLVYKNNRILILSGKPIATKPLTKKIDVDVIIFTQNPTLYVKEVAAIFNCKQYVFDASNSFKKISYWKKDAIELQLPCHVVSEQGAFELPL